MPWNPAARIAITPDPFSGWQFVVDGQKASEGEAVLLTTLDHKLVMEGRLATAPDGRLYVEQTNALQPGEWCHLETGNPLRIEIKPENAAPVEVDEMPPLPRDMNSFAPGEVRRA